MILSSHILAGAAMAAKVQNPFLGIFLAFISHYLLDTFPHAEYSIKNIQEKRWKKSIPDFYKVFLDASSGMLLVYLIAGSNSLIFAGTLAAMAPDGITLLYILFPKIKLLQIHQSLHNWLNGIGQKKKISIFWRIVTQVAAGGIAIYFLLQPQTLLWG